MSTTGEPEVTLPGLPTSEPESQPPGSDPKTEPRTRRQQQTFSAEDLERVRQEEKDKLYARLGHLEELETEVQQFKEREAEAEKQRKKQEKDAEQARLAAEREKMNAQELVESYKKEQEQEMQRLREEVERERVLRQKEREFSDLLAYKAQRMEEEADSIMPELRDFVSGNSREDIDRAIEVVKERTQRIMNQVQEGLQQQRAGQPGVRPTGAPPTGPVTMGEPRELSLDDLKEMSMEDYERMRPQLHNAVKRARQG